jgi:hypothetical protein
MEIEGQKIKASHVAAAVIQDFHLHLQGQNP